VLYIKERHTHGLEDYGERRLRTRSPAPHETLLDKPRTDDAQEIQHTRAGRSSASLPEKKPTTTLDTNVNTSQSSDPNNPIHGTPKESKQSREYKKEKSNAPAI
jgi:hypothetical protein